MTLIQTKFNLYNEAFKFILPSYDLELVKLLNFISIIYAIYRTFIRIIKQHLIIETFYQY
jgi:hypothetical protein